MNNTTKSEEGLLAELNTLRQRVAEIDKYQSLFDHIQICIAVYEAIDNGGSFIFKEVNTAMEKVEQVKRQDILGRSVTEVFPGVLKFGLFEIFQRVWKTGLPEHHPISWYADNRIAGWRENYIYKLPDGEIVAVYEDATERKRAEQVLEEQSIFQQAIIDSITEGVCVGQEIQDVPYIQFSVWNRQMYEITGYTREEINHLGLQVLFPTLYLRRRVVTHLRRIRKGKQLVREGWNLTTRNDEKRHVCITTTYLSCNFKILAVVQDITEIQQREQILLENEMRFRTLVECLPCIVYAVCFDKDQHSFYISPQIQSILGFTPAEIHSRQEWWASQLHPDDRDRTLAEVFHCYNTGEALSIEYRMIAKDKSIKWIYDKAIVIQDSHGHRILQGIFQDITSQKQFQEEREELESQLRQAEKMKALGHLAGGIAHDFNNQLTGIMGYAELLSMQSKSQTEIEYADKIVQISQRCSDLTHQLLAFARKGKNLSVPVNIHKLIDEVISILERSIDKRIAINTNKKADIPMTMGDPTQLQNALLNVGINARDAMPQGGTLTFTTDNVCLDEGCSWKYSCEIKPGTYLQITVTDNGMGMDIKTQDRLFEPFCTKKIRGTGLGLASVYGIVKNHGGAIHVESHVGIGTTFELYLPLATSDHREVSSTASAPLVGTAQILLVDDEDVIRKSAAMILKNLGYQVKICIDGIDAIEYFTVHWQKIDLVILDLIMPRMNGKDTFLALKEIHPKVRVLICSGYSANEEVQHLIQIGAVGFIAKPFRVAEFSRAISDALASYH